MPGASPGHPQCRGASRGSQNRDQAVPTAQGNQAEHDGDFHAAAETGASGGNSWMLVCKAWKAAPLTPRTKPRGSEADARLTHSGVGELSAGLRV